MDAPTNTRSVGLRFAEQQMQRHGWTEGKGLGKREDGISEAIKVKVKCDTAGVGHNSAEQFTFHWWDHVFNKTASSIEVEPDQDGVKVKKLSGDDGGAVSSKKPRKAMLSRDMLYGRFIKSATLTSGGEKPVQDSSSSDTSDSSEDEDSRLDLSSATKLSDEDLVKICGGRTAHKGARYGLTMSAKLSRIEEQERAFMEKYGKKQTKGQPSMSAAGEETPEDINDEKRHKKKKQKEDDDCGEERDNHSKSEAPKKKKKKRRSRDIENIEMAEEAEALGNHNDDLSEDYEDARPAKKKKKRKAVEPEESMSNGHTEDENTGEARKSKKKRNNVEPEESIMSNGHPEDWGDSAHENTGEATKSKKKRNDIECEESIMSNGHTEEENTDEARKSKKKKKKKDKRSEDCDEMVKAEEEQPRTPREVGEESDQYTEERSRKKKNRVGNEDESQNGEDTKAKKKKNKSKTYDRD